VIRAIRVHSPND